MFQFLYIDRIRKETQLFLLFWQFTNNFSVPLTFESVVLMDSRFEIISAPEGKLALPGNTWPPVNLMFNSTDVEQSSQSLHNVTMLIKTNATIHE